MPVVQRLVDAAGLFAEGLATVLGAGFRVVAVLFTWLELSHPVCLPDLTCHHLPRVLPVLVSLVPS